MQMEITQDGNQHSIVRKATGKGRERRNMQNLWRNNRNSEKDFGKQREKLKSQNPEFEKYFTETEYVDVLLTDRKAEVVANGKVNP